MLCRYVKTFLNQQNRSYFVQELKYSLKQINIFIAFLHFVRISTILTDENNRGFIKLIQGFV